MYHRTETIHLRRGQQQLAISSEIDGGVVRYVGSIDGKRYLTSPTREGAVSGLLRRLVSRAQESLVA